MNHELRISSEDRLMFVAPHPDDEALAGGGLLQRADVTGAKVQVIYATDGDNNPWPQRVIERKLKIRISDRARWGARRRHEAIAALSCLGVEESSVHFMGLPDQGITQIFLTSSEKLIPKLSAIISNWQPTHIIMPAATDLHPDHNALSMLFRLALDRLFPDPGAITRLHYVVHGKKEHHPKGNSFHLKLSPLEKAGKRKSILSHSSQMVLSSRRFLSYAKNTETFFASNAAKRIGPGHPIKSANITGNRLNLLIARRKIPSSLTSTTIYLAIEDFPGKSVRWELVLPSGSGRARIRDLGTNAVLKIATVRVRKTFIAICFPIPKLSPASHLFVKIQRNSFLDEIGWQEIKSADRIYTGIPVEERVLAYS